MYSCGKDSSISSKPYIAGAFETFPVAYTAHMNENYADWLQGNQFADEMAANIQVDTASLVALATLRSKGKGKGRYYTELDKEQEQGSYLECFAHSHYSIANKPQNLCITPSHLSPYRGGVHNFPIFSLLSQCGTPLRGSIFMSLTCTIVFLWISIFHSCRNSPTLAD